MSGTIINPGFGTCEFKLLDMPSPRSWFSPWRAYLDRRVELIKELVYTRPDGTQCVIPAGFTSDGPSFPVLCAWFLPSRLRVLESGIYHDYLCRVLKHKVSWCDAEFREALHSQGIGYRVALECYLGLRAASYLHLR